MIDAVYTVGATIKHLKIEYNRDHQIEVSVFGVYLKYIQLKDIRDGQILFDKLDDMAAEAGTGH